MKQLPNKEPELTLVPVVIGLVFCFVGVCLIVIMGCLHVF